VKLSAQMPLFSEGLTLSSAASLDLASRFPSPGSSAGEPTSGTSGPSLLGSSENSDPLGFLLRTCLASELSLLTKSSKTWKRQATPHGRSWWVLTTLGRRTVERGCGLLPGSDWPTATANESATRTNCGGAQGRVGPERPMLAGAVLNWPTATASDAMDTDGTPRPSRAATNRKTEHLARMVLWPTPQVWDATKENLRSDRIGRTASRHS